MRSSVRFSSLSSIPAIVADLDPTVNHPNRENGGRFERWRRECLAGADAEARAVTRADDLVSLHWPTREDAAIVGAEVFDGVVAPLQVENSNPGAVDLHHPVSARRKLGGRTHRDPATHATRTARFETHGPHSAVLRS